MNNTQKLETRVCVKAPMEEVWDFFQTAQNITAMTPPDQKVRIERNGDVPLHPGLEIRISVSPALGIRTGWLTRIEEVHPAGKGEREAWFRDTQRQGPFSIWNHTHRFRSLEEGGTEILDQLEYRLPFGRLGQAVAGWWIQRQMQGLFAFRTSALHQTFGAL